MKKFCVEIHGFSQGEVSDYIGYKSEQVNYIESAKDITNLIVTPYGPLTRRPGTKFLNISNDDTKKVIRLISFTHEDNDFVIEIGCYSYMGFFNFYKNSIPMMKDNFLYTINTPWNTKDKINNLNYVMDNSNNKVYFFEEKTAPMELSFDSSYNFNLSENYFH
jgi:hypothetical protein